jgi:SAM-dependent methyltransferase
MIQHMKQEPRGSAPPASLLRRLLKVVRRAVPSRQYVRHRGYLLPPPEMRSRMCGSEYASNDYFLDSGSAEAKRLMSRLAYTSNSNVVEIGSGLGRMAIGLLREAGAVKYWGFDANKPWIAWCRKHIERSHPSFRFIHVDVENDLYNPEGAAVAEDFRFPLPDGHADIVYMWGVFTNMRLQDARIYVAEISRLLRDGGRLFLTAFVEKNVQPESINPVGYVDYECKFPLHVVRYEQDGLFAMFAAHGLTVDEFSYHGGAHCNQSEIYLRKVAGPRTAPHDRTNRSAASPLGGSSSAAQSRGTANDRSG